jgi:DNA-binding LytR/AlgR family response regulator
MKLNCIIVDDEPLSRNFLEKFCAKSGKADVQHSFSHARDAIAYLRNNEVQLVFLDVEMPEINGFQMLDQLHYMPIVIMTTSKTDYAVTAFEYNVTDFLKKPIEYGRFLDALTKAEEICKRNLSEEDIKKNIVIKSNGIYIRLDYSDILYVEGMGDYVKYVTPDKTCYP